MKQKGGVHEYQNLNQYLWMGPVSNTDNIFGVTVQYLIFWRVILLFNIQTFSYLQYYLTTNNRYNVFTHY